MTQKKNERAKREIYVIKFRIKLLSSQSSTWPTSCNLLTYESMVDARLLSQKEAQERSRRGDREED